MTNSKAIKIGEALDLLRQRLYDAAFAEAGAIGVPDIYVPQALVMAAAIIIIDIHKNFTPEIALNQWINSVGGAIDTMVLNGVTIPPYEKSSPQTQNIVTGMGKPN